MTDEEKIHILDGLDEQKELGEKELDIIERFKDDADAFVRSRCASQLSRFSNEKALELLFSLAIDDDAFVRLESYDSMRSYRSYETEQFLRKVILRETDDLARNYAILSWAETVKYLGYDISSAINFVMCQKSTEKSSHCQLAFCYSQYIFGDIKALNEMLLFLKNKDYHIRCSVLNLLKSIVYESNKKSVKIAIHQMLLTEKSKAVREDAEKLISQL